VKPWIVSTDALKNLVVSSWETGLELCRDRPFNGAIISLEVNPVYPNLLLTGTMDANHGLVEIKEEGDRVYLQTHQKWQSHSKFVIRVKWHPNGHIFATASHDATIIIWQLDDTHKNATELKRYEFKSNVEAIEFTKDGKKLIAAIRENAFLQYIDLDNWQIVLSNVNALGDDYVSFSVLELKLSPDGTALLASTDMSRAILFRQGTETQLQNFYGFDSDGFNQPRTTFDNQGLAYMTSQDFRIHIYDTKSGSHVLTLPPHAAVVRDLDYHPDADLLASGSFDKTIKIWKRPSSH
jgi:COMPASS component SWD3